MSGISFLIIWVGKDIYCKNLFVELNKNLAISISLLYNLVADMFISDVCRSRMQRLINAPDQICVASGCSD